MGLLLLAACWAWDAPCLWQRLRASDVATGITWGCGYAAPTARMQYTSSSFAQMLVGLFGWALRPQVHRPAEMPLFPREDRFPQPRARHGARRAVLPSFRVAARLFSWFRVFHQGSIQTYLLYIFLTLVALLLWRLMRTRWLSKT